MTSSDDFQVIPEEQEEEQDDVMDNLRELVFLFHSSVDALNQSTILLKDELQNALSLALQRVEPSGSSKTEELLKSFSAALTGTDDVRKNYVRRLCTKLVSLESEKRELEAECMRLKGGAYLEGDKAEVDMQMGAVTKTLGEISAIVSQLEDKSVAEALVAGPDLLEHPTLLAINTCLIDIRDRLSNLNLSVGQRSEAKVEDKEQPEFVKTESDAPRVEPAEKDTKKKEQNDEKSKPVAEKRPVDPVHELFQRKLALTLEEGDQESKAESSREVSPGSEREPSRNRRNRRKVKFGSSLENTGDEEKEGKHDSPLPGERNARGVPPYGQGDPQQWYGPFRGTPPFRYFRYGAPHNMGGARWSKGPYPPEAYSHIPFPPPGGFGPQRMYGGPRPLMADFGGYGSGPMGSGSWAGGGRGGRPPRPSSQTRHEDRSPNWIPDFIYE